MRGQPALLATCRKPCCSVPCGCQQSRHHVRHVSPPVLPSFRSLPLLQKILAFDFDTLVLRLGPLTLPIPLKDQLPRKAASYRRTKESPFFRQGRNASLLVAAAQSCKLLHDRMRCVAQTPVLPLSAAQLCASIFSMAINIAIYMARNRPPRPWPCLLCSFFYVDERVVAARGRGGGIALWARTSPTWELEKGIV